MFTAECNFHDENTFHQFRSCVFQPLPNSEVVIVALDNFSTYKEDLANYTLEPLEGVETNGKVVCSGNEFCCTFNVTLKEARKDNNYYYR